MSHWENRTNYIQTYFNTDPLTYIPMIEEGKIISYDKKVVFNNLCYRIQKEVDNVVAKKIIIMDPYFQASDLKFAIRCFASMTGRHLSIITRLKMPQDIKCLRIENDDSKIQEQLIQKLISIKQELIRKKIFAEIKIFKASKKFHDRYLFFLDGEKDDIFISLGGSINAVESNFSSIQRVTNDYFKRKLLTLKDILCENADEL